MSLETMINTINTPRRTPICAACGCSLVRLGVGKDEAVPYGHNGKEYRFCCRGCVEVFAGDSERLLHQYERRMDEVVICPGCLGEIPIRSAVEVQHGGEVFGFCRCPHCKQAFERNPEHFMRRLFW
jgi:YHS domain-containing protein